MLQEVQISDSPGWAGDPEKQAPLHSDEPPSLLLLYQSCTVLHRSQRKRQNKALLYWLIKKKQEKVMNFTTIILQHLADIFSVSHCA